MRIVTAAAPAATLRARFEVEVLPHRATLLRAARRLTRTEFEAEDLLQDTLLRAYAGFGSFEPGTNVRAWLFRILNNQWISTFRHRQCRPTEVLVDHFTDRDVTGSFAHQSNDGCSAEVQALTMHLDAEIRAALAALPVGFRTAVYYADVQGYTYRETAAIMGIPAGTVMSRVFRARQRLRIALADTAGRQGIPTALAALGAA